MLIPADPFAWARPRENRDKDAGDPLRVVDGLSLRMADECAQAWGVPATAPLRIVANLTGQLEEAAREGHSCQPIGRAVQTLRNRLRLDPAFDLVPVLRYGREQGFLAPDPPTGSIYLPELLEAERQIAEAIRHRSRPALTELADPGPDLSTEQTEAFHNAFRHPVSIITGPPGRGKSRTVIEITAACQRADLSILLTAPTGRAAVRLSELARSYGVELDEAPGTVHRKILGARRPPRADLVVIEESSMLDVEVAAAALRRLPPNAHLVFVGDSDQLPSVGPGTVLRDLIASGQVPAVELTRNYRVETADLAGAVDAVRTGEIPDKGPHFTAREVPPHVFQSSEGTIGLIQQALRWLAGQYQVPAEEVLILVPRSSRGPNLHTAAENLNPPLRRLLNPAAARLEPHQLGSGDRVLHRKNVYDPLFRFNGDRGTVRQVARDGEVVVDFPDRSTTYSAEQAREYLVLAFASTVHRAQGGEADVVLVLLRNSDTDLLLQRRLVYTAISRSRRACLVLTEPGAFQKALRNTREERRHGNLVSRLRGEV